MMSEFAVNPAALLHRLKVPVLILQGDADKNVSVADAQTLAAARPDATLKVFPGVNHSQRIAKDDPGRGPGPLAPGIIEAIADFMKAHT
jgi:pimeloyl-ACP methyl ester carboxylesterase